MRSETELIQRLQELKDYSARQQKEKTLIPGAADKYQRTIDKTSWQIEMLEWMLNNK